MWLPDPDDNRYGYAMSQGGYLGRYDRKTGYTKTFALPSRPQNEGTVQLELGARTRSL